MSSALTWTSWVKDPLIERAGVTFDRTPARHITAPPGMFRVCAYHIDFDERPTCYADVAALAEAVAVSEHLRERCGWNVDYARVFDDRGAEVYDGRTGAAPAPRT